jgi:Winged helix DNA-binding domain
MANSAIAHCRLLQHHIAGTRFEHPDEVVRWMGAMQAQDYQQALWAVGLRMRAPTLANVEAALASGKIILTWPLRGTLHFAAAENVRWMLELLVPRRLAADQTRRRQLELDERTLERCGRLFRDALAGGQRLSRAALMRLLESAQINPTGQRGYHILWYLAQTGLICLGPRQGKEQTFVLLDEWAPVSRRLTREAALAELAGCYFASHGPATVADFATWAGLTLADARAGLETAGSSLVLDRHDGKAYWRSADASDAPLDASSVYLLPGFDEYLLGYKDRSDVLAATHAGKVAPGGNGVFFPIIVVGGQVVGTWKRTVRKDTVAVTLTRFTELAVSSERIDEAARRYSDFVGLSLV